MQILMFIGMAKLLLPAPGHRGFTVRDAVVQRRELTLSVQAGTPSRTRTCLRGRMCQ